jgi:hypothetical protein
MVAVLLPVENAMTSASLIPTSTFQGWCGEASQIRTR